MEGIVSAEARDLRFINFLGAFALSKVLIAILEHSPTNTDGQKEGSDDRGFLRRHTVANILLFPPLFFFYGLYYTDVLSVLSVLVTYLCYLKKAPLLLLLSGLVSLGFRQTNIFWVAIYLGVLEVSRTVRRMDVPAHTPLSSITGHKMFGAEVYDPAVADAALEGTFIPCPRVQASRMLDN